MGAVAVITTTAPFLIERMDMGGWSNHVVEEAERLGLDPSAPETETIVLERDIAAAEAAADAERDRGI